MTGLCLCVCVRVCASVSVWRVAKVSAEVVADDQLAALKRKHQDLLVKFKAMLDKYKAQQGELKALKADAAPAAHDTDAVVTKLTNELQSLQVRWTAASPSVVLHSALAFRYLPSSVPCSARLAGAPRRSSPPTGCRNASASPHPPTAG